jgi:FkbM family methyltransferase
LSNNVDAELLSRFGDFPVITFADVGAGGGLPQSWAGIRKYLKIIGFEPDKDRFGALHKTQRDHYFNCALSDRERTLDFHINQLQEVSSFLRPNWQFVDQFEYSDCFRELRTIPIQARTLNSIVAENPELEIDFLKLGTQSHDFEILEGAKNCLIDSVFGVEVEVYFQTVYQDQHLFGNIMNLMAQYEFEVFDLQRAYWKRKNGKDLGGEKGQIVYGNCLFLKNYAAYLGRIEQLPSAERYSSIKKYIVVSLLYGYGDYADHVLSEAKNMISESEFKEIHQAITANATWPKILLFKGRDRIEIFLKGLLQYFRKGSTFYMDPFIGNRR